MSSVGPRSPEGVISGSFKFKPEIDAAITEFRDLNVIIRAPESGWLYVPSHGLIVATSNEQFQPLPSEQHMLAGEVETAFLHQLDQSDFVYVMNPEGYLGDMSIFEIGYTQGIKKPLYASHPLSFQALGIRDPKMIDLLRTSVPVMSPAAAARDVHRKLAAEAPIVDRISSQGAQKVAPPSPRATIAEGAIIRHGGRVLLVEDGRWQHERLTIPGTQLRSGERRAAALKRLVIEKVGADIADVAHFATSFMLPESGYKGLAEAETFVFDDHSIAVQSEHVRPQSGVVPMWASNAEIETFIANGQVEPNAAQLLADYLQTQA